MPIITISRGAYSGGEQFAERLGRRLGLKVLSREVLIETAQTYGVSEEELIRGLERPISFWDRLTHQKQRFITAIQTTLAEMLEDGGGIYHGHAGQFLLKGLSCVAKVRLLVPIETRVRNCMTATGMDEDQARIHVQAEDDRRVRWVSRMYGVDWHDASLFDVVLNLEHLSMDSAVETVAMMVERPEYECTTEGLNELRDFRIRCRVQAELLFNSSFTAAGIEVDVHRGVVRLSGSAFDANPREVVRFVKGVNGVRGVTPDPDGQDQWFSETGVSPEDRTVREVMLAPERYPQVDQRTPIRDAMIAIVSSSVRFEDGHFIPPRYVLVHDAERRLVGVLSRRDLVKGLVPRLRAAEETEQHIRDLVPYGRERDLDLYIQWSTLFSRAAIEASLEPVSSVMAPIRATVEPDDPLSTVITSMIRYGVDLIPVTEGEAIVGVVLMTDIFDLVAQYIMENSNRPSNGEGEGST